MKNKAYIKVDSKKCFSAIRRYLRYIFNIESSVLERKRILDHSIILIDEDVSVDKDWLDFFNTHLNLKIIIFGLWRESNEVYVNLLDLAHLKTNIQSAINRKKTTISPILLLKNVEQQIRLLFKAHGEESLVDILNKTINLLSNGPNLLRENMLEWDEYVKTYFNTGLENWIFLKKRFKKYKIYFKVCGFEKELAIIEKNINLFQDYLNKLNTLDKDEIMKMDEKTINMNIDYINQINNILIGLKQKIDSISDAE